VLCVCGMCGVLIGCVSVVVVGLYCVMRLWYLWVYNLLCDSGSYGHILCCVDVVFVGLEFVV